MTRNHTIPKQVRAEAPPPSARRKRAGGDSRGGRRGEIALMQLGIVSAQTRVCTAWCRSGEAEYPARRGVCHPSAPKAPAPCGRIPRRTVSSDGDRMGGSHLVSIFPCFPFPPTSADPRGGTPHPSSPVLAVGPLPNGRALAPDVYAQAWGPRAAGTAADVAPSPTSGHFHALQQ